MHDNPGGGAGTGRGAGKPRIVCWSCGSGLEGVEFPIRRLTECPRCRADLHVCLLCRHYDPHAIGQCRHDRAEGVLVKDKANFCNYFRPAPGRYSAAAAAESAEARARLEALFGSPAGPDGDPSPSPGEEAKSEEERAREELARLFGLPPERK